MEGSELLADCIFGGIGVIATILSRSSNNRKVEVTGWIMILFPWVLTGAYEWVIGIILTLCLFLFRKKSDTLL